MLTQDYVSKVNAAILDQTSLLAVKARVESQGLLAGSKMRCPLKTEGTFPATVAGKVEFVATKDGKRGYFALPIQCQGKKFSVFTDGDTYYQVNQPLTITVTKGTYNGNVNFSAEIAEGQVHEQTVPNQVLSGLDF
jgi:hypothetical protein